MSNPSTTTLTRRQLANAIRALSMDAVEKAGSGHPGAPMGMADLTEVLWNDFMRHNPANPDWINRDRFIISNGHGSMLLYAVLHLCGYDLSIDDIKQFRQLDSKTPGHPEYGLTPGVETTTGPLGQGMANAVGMALAERNLASYFNQSQFKIIDHLTYFTVGEGCLMEGISHEAASLAGTQKLGKLIGFFDRNQISIDGAVSTWFTEDIAKRFEAYGWQVITPVDGHDPKQVKLALSEAIAESTYPTLICCDTIIGYGAPKKQGKESCHGAPLGTDEVKLARQELAWDYTPFEIPSEYYAAWDARKKGEQLETEWQQLFNEYKSVYPDLATEFTRRIDKKLPATWQHTTQQLAEQTLSIKKSLATRQASHQTLNALGPVLPELIGGSADLTGSNLTLWQGAKTLSAEYPKGNYLYYGVREFAMSAINNGIALYGGFIPYGGTFLIFSEYARNALRMAALMKIQNIFVFTHDSISLGEDGPTHQAIEQVATLRLIPNMSVWRPCDAVETAMAWQSAIEQRDGPTALLFTRQALAPIDRMTEHLSLIRHGGYVLVEPKGLEKGAHPELIIIATGSEVKLAVTAAEALNRKKRKVRVVSMPSTDIFDKQSQKYRDSVLPPPCKKRIAVEAGIRDYWRKYVGLEGGILGVDSFGKSAPADELFKHFGFTEENLTTMATKLLDEIELE